MAKYVYAAMLGNFLIALTKFIVGFISRSSSMISEAYHSIADTFNQVMLAFGIKLSERKPDVEHPFGYSKEQFFWSLIVSIMIFAGAGILSLVQGYEKLINEGSNSLEHSLMWNYIVLILAIIFESMSYLFAIREVKHLKHEKQRKSVRETLEYLDNPVLLTVLAEDTLALIGLIIALVATILTDLTQSLLWDAIGSLVIGVLLVIGGLFLASKNKTFLIGRTVNPEHKKLIMDIVQKNPFVEGITALRTMLLGSEDMLITLELNLRDDLSTNEVEKVIDEIEDSLINAFPRLNRSKIVIELSK